MTPALDRECKRAVDLGPHIVARDRKVAERGCDIEGGERIGGSLDRFRRRGDQRGQALEGRKLDAERTVGCVRDLGLELAELGGGETDLAGERLAMNERRVERRGQELLAML